MADFCVLTPAPRTRVRVRGVVLQKSSHFRSLRLADGGEESQICTFRVPRSFSSTILRSLPFFASQLPNLSSGESRSITSSHRRVALLCDGCFSYCYALHRDKSEPLCVSSFSSLIIVSQQAPLVRVKAQITRSPPQYAYGLHARESELFCHWRECSVLNSQNFHSTTTTYPYNFFIVRLRFDRP